MKYRKKKGGYAAFLTAILLMLAAAVFFIAAVPDRICVLPTDTVPQQLPGGIRLIEDEKTAASQDAYSAAAGEFCTHRSAEAKLFGVLTLKTVDVSTVREKKVYPGGMPFGVSLSLRGVLVVDLCGVAGHASPAAAAGIRQGDVITAVNGREIRDAEDLGDTVSANGGAEVTLTVLRGERSFFAALTPLSENGEYRAGLLVRDSTAGIGTVTFIDPDSGAFGGLGHGITDGDGSSLLKMRSGIVRGVRLGGVRRGTEGVPGELRGSFSEQRLGELFANTACGVFGVLAQDTYHPATEPVPLGFSDTIREGEAEILSTVSTDGEIGRYSVVITKIIGGSDNKSFLLTVTDPSLLEKTGGIVQGMSGSPILQDGRLVGAVTHVMVNDPTRGYGVFIENMLANMQSTP